MTLREMLARREAIRTELRSIQEAHPAGALPAEAETRWGGLTGELATLDAATARQATLDDLDRRAALGAPVGTDARFAAEARSVGMLDTIRAQLRGANDEAAGRAKEMSREIELRSGRRAEGLFWPMAAAEMRTTTSGRQGTAGEAASLVPTTLRGDLFTDRLQNATVVRGLGATVLADLNGNVDVPRRTASVGASWFSENTPIPMTDAAFDKVGLRPKYVGALTELSVAMVQQTSPDVEALTRDDMAKTMAEAMDAAALFGAGDGVVPMGVIGTPGVASVPFNGAAPTWGNVLAMGAALDTANVATDARGWVGSGTVKAKLMGTPKVAGAGGSNFGFLMDMPGMLAGVRFATTNSIPVTPATTGAGATPALSTLILGNWSDLLIGVWSDGLDLSVNPYADEPYRRGNVLVRAILTADVNVRHPASFAVATDVAA